MLIDLASPVFEYKTLAHISDLHIGRWSRSFKSTVLLYQTLIKQKVDYVVVSGDVTENGRLAEYRIFNEIFSDLIGQGRVFLVPGNHDRLGHEVANMMMNGNDLEIFRAAGLHLIRLDTTGAHNRRLFSGHGHLDQSRLERLVRAVAEAQPSDLVVVIFHHHPLSLPEDLISEKIASFFRWPYASELALGMELVKKLRGTCDLLLHGHRHKAWEHVFSEDSRPLHIYNAGASNLLGGFRLFKFTPGKLWSPPEWIKVEST